MKSTILFSDEFTPNEKAVLRTSFKANIESLGIGLEDFTVLFQKGAIGKTALGKMSEIGSKLFNFTLNITNSMIDSIFATGHELVHVRQYLHGQLRDQNNGVYWNNKYVPAMYCNSPVYYKVLPWEVEAHGLQDALFDKAMAALLRSSNEPVKRAVDFFKAQQEEQVNARNLKTQKTG